MDKTKAHRNSTWRGRKAAGIIVCSVELNSAALTEALRRKGVIAPDYSPGRRELGAYAAAALALFSSEAKEPS